MLRSNTSILKETAKRNLIQHPAKLLNILGAIMKILACSDNNSLLLTTNIIFEEQKQKVSVTVIKSLQKIVSILIFMHTIYSTLRVWSIVHLISSLSLCVCVCVCVCVQTCTSMIKCIPQERPDDYSFFCKTGK